MTPCKPAHNTAQHSSQRPYLFQFTPPPTMFYIARNTLPFTRNMSKKAALALWEANKSTEATDGAQYQLCKDTGSINPVVVMDLV